MLDTIQSLKDISSMPEAQSDFARFLGLDKPLSVAVIRHAMADQYFRHNLIICRSRPAMLAQLLAHPRNAEFEDDPGGTGMATADEARARGTGELAARLGQSMFEWAKSGFSRVDDATFEHRFSTCEGCDRLTAPPETLAYRLASAGRGENRVCSACGCLAARKARLTSENCPLASADDPGVSRWGEPLTAEAVPDLRTGA